MVGDFEIIADVVVAHVSKGEGEFTEDAVHLVSTVAFDKSASGSASSCPVQEG